TYHTHLITTTISQANPQHLQHLTITPPPPPQAQHTDTARMKRNHVIVLILLLLFFLIALGFWLFWRTPRLYLRRSAEETAA
ncbi:MAG: hypothetical protein Q9184_008342, partial [Pyrenodesmia sp. 2 TL-2023]